MSNDYYERKAELKPFTTARSDDVRGELDAIQSGFEKLAKPRQDGTIGFLTPFTIVNPTEDNHPATKAMVAAENSKNTEQDGRLEQVENALSGIGPVNGRYTTLRYVATAGQDTIVLPAQFGSLAYVFVNGARKFQTVNFVYDVNTKTLTFLSALALNDEVLVDVGVVPDAVLADLIAIQNDIASKHSDVQTWHSDVEQWQQEVANDKQTTLDAKDTAVSARDETVLARNTVVALYLGPKNTAPTTDNDGNPLINGANYYNTTDGKTYVWWNGLWEVTNLSTTTTVAKTGTAGAAIMPTGTEDDRPDTTDVTYILMRGRSDTGEVEAYNPVTDEWGAVGGGGIPVYIDKTSDFTAAKKKAYTVPMTDDVNKTVTIDSNFIADDWLSVSFMQWGTNIGGKNALLNFADVPLRISGVDYTEYEVLEPCVMQLSHKGTYWEVVGFTGGAGSYYALEQRVDDLEQSYQRIVNYNGLQLRFRRIGKLVECNLTGTTSSAISRTDVLGAVPEGYVPSTGASMQARGITQTTTADELSFSSSGDITVYATVGASAYCRGTCCWLTKDAYPTGDEI